MNKNLQKVRFPGIAEMNARADELRRKGRTLFNLGQAIPFFSPPAECLRDLADSFADPLIHRYSLDPGWRPLREIWCECLSRDFSLKVDPDREILITAGANSAYLMAVMALLNPGDRMGLLTPWYFNHEMAVSMAGGEVVPIRLDAASGFALDPERILTVARQEKLTALTLVSPNNPTGTTYDPAALRHLAQGLLHLGVPLISDETYAYFPNPGYQHFSPGSLETQPDQIITIGSFSKTFAMTGWRVGYLLASAPRLEQMLKIQDTMVICASHPGQRLALACLKKAFPWLDERRQELVRRQELMERRRLDFGAWQVRSTGLFFAWLDGPTSGREAALKILDQANVILIPGDVFGPGFENSLRLSLGCCSETDLDEGLTRLTRFFQRPVG